MLCIEGPKWCGKTWTSSHHANSEFLVGDPSGNFSNRMLAELEPYTVLKGDAPRLIDEWQEVPALWDATRAFVDESGGKGQIILTGSSTPVNKGVLHSGTGRIKSIRMNTMSLYESGDSTGDVSLKKLFENKDIESKVAHKIELEKIAEVVKKHELWCLSDEIYCELLYDDRKHVSIGSFPGMKDYAIRK